VLSQPLFVVGSPRSGTTFLVRMLNQHPAIHITNETRIFVLLKDMIDIRGRHPWLLETPYQAQPSPHCAFANKPLNSDAVETARANASMSGSSRCSGMLGINS
jgi:hypothetical protein